MFGLLLYAIGIVVTIKANIGYGPWEIFHAGLGKTLGITIGNASIVVGLAVVIITLAMKERLGLGTIMNMLVIGVFIDIIIKYNIIPVAVNRVVGVIVLIVGLYIISLASYFYISSGFGAGPRDSLMVALTRRTSLPIGVIRGSIELTATLVGWALGGMAGPGTVISGFAIGFCIQTTFRVLKFKPTEVRHSTLLDTWNELRLSWGKSS